ncbi:hypothetical protein ASPZODRAFT_14151 [Penicilliopsis zonata CBS 506.65]|uniref:Uncharacterized protein n=1 Tax=Penicilliopsis zonata CBS 506.65 TaxID=1073090 RepID=A0A1L9SQQ7_9EURO|nr:hypothetical protein ASPZODRAFT_14151 [Penicilliopsis zonata CBS 506.65]OJJ49437.1 hypothetical protein ASPZODRAFT_14151 [Penicilliopsis zonata CBS 506.65]
MKQQTLGSSPSGDAEVRNRAGSGTRDEPPALFLPEPPGTKARDPGAQGPPTFQGTDVTPPWAVAPRVTLLDAAPPFGPNLAWPGGGTSCFPKNHPGPSQRLRN